jgi:Holliday junction DNA helicase RuvA
VIGKLTGVIDSLNEDGLLLDVNGVGYVVHASSKTIGRLGAAGANASILVETQVREDAITLFGFADHAERDWFRLLRSVQGVGGKVALAILSTLTPNDLVNAVASQDKASVSRASGVGPKLAQRIVSELKDKAAGLELGVAALRQGRGGGRRDQRCRLGPGQSRLSPRRSLWRGLESARLQDRQGRAQ